MTDQLAPPQFTEIQNRLASIEAKLSPDNDGKLVVQMWKADQVVYKEQEAKLKECSKDRLSLTCKNINLEAELNRLKDRIADLFPMIAHGDAEHRKWLQKAIEEHFAEESTEDNSA